MIEIFYIVALMAFGLALFLAGILAEVLQERKLRHQQQTELALYLAKHSCRKPRSNSPGYVGVST